MNTASSAWPQTAASAGVEIDVDVDVDVNVDIDVDATEGDAALQILLLRMREQTDFPALSASVARIQQVAASDSETLHSLSEEVMQDVALTHKLLRMVNTAHFSQHAGGGVSTVSRAVALIGFGGIRNMALSVLLLDHMGDRAHALQLKEEFLRALMAATLADELAPRGGEREDAFLAAMFQNLGRLLSEFYFPDESKRIRRALAPAPTAAAPVASTPVSHARREAAARGVLGIGFDELGLGVARSWGLPQSLQRALRTPEGDVPRRPFAPGSGQDAERMRWLGRSANALTDALLQHADAAQVRAVQAVADLYAPVLGVSRRDIVTAVASARLRMERSAQALGITVPLGTPARRLLEQGLGADLRGAIAEAATGGPAAVTDAAQASAEMSTPIPIPPRAAPDATALLHAACDACEAAVHEKSLSLDDLLTPLMAAMQRAIGFRAVVFCLRDPANGQLLGRAGTGAGAEALRTAARIRPDAAATNDLFALLCAKGADLLVADACAPSIASRLPPWFRACAPGGTFLLLPLAHRQTVLGLIYADKADAGSLVIAPPQLVLLRRLRDLLVQALTPRPEEAADAAPASRG